MKDSLGQKLQGIRIETVIPHITGRLLDIGCGLNQLVKTYGNGVGVDVYPWEGVDVVVEDTAKMPFTNGEFDTASILAALNHIPNRDKVLTECHRVLKPNGKLLITMIPPVISRVWHFLRSPWDDDQHERGMKEGEVFGFTKQQVIALAEKSGFKLQHTQTFMMGINRLYVFTKK